MKLHRVPFAENGELKTITYYKDVQLDKITGDKTYLNPCVYKTLEYVRVGGYLFNRTATLYWYDVDGEKDINNIKVMTTYYNNEEAIEGGKKQRNYIVNNLLINVVGLLMQTEGITIDEADEIGSAYVGFLGVNVDNYLKGYMTTLLEIVLTETDHKTGITYFYPTTCVHDNKLYKCKDAATGEFDADLWDMGCDFTWLNNVIPGSGITIRQYVYSVIDYK